MKLLFTVFILMYGTYTYGQEVPACEIILVSPKIDSVISNTSNNGDFLVRLEIIDGNKDYELMLFEWNGESYDKKHSSVLMNFLPRKVHVNDSGKIVILFNDIHTSSSYVGIYDKDTSLDRIISGAELGYPIDKDGCREKNPWVCWDLPFQVNGDVYSLYTQDNKLIDISLNTGTHKKYDSSYDSCWKSNKR